MPPRHPEQTRHRCLVRVANGEPDTVVAADEGVPLGTVRSWVSRSGGHLPELAEDDDPGEDRDRPELAELSRADYLALSIVEVDRDIMRARAAGAWGAIRGLHDVRSTLHRERGEVLRAEGSQLDLTADPRAIARQVLAADAILRVLTVPDAE